MNICNWLISNLANMSNIDSLQVVQWLPTKQNNMRTYKKQCAGMGGFRKWYKMFPANTKLETNAGLMLGQRRRRWANINPALTHHPVSLSRQQPWVGRQIRDADWSGQLRRHVTPAK